MREIPQTAHSGYSLSLALARQAFPEISVKLFKAVALLMECVLGENQDEVGPWSICKLSMKLKEPLIGSFRLMRSCSGAPVKGGCL